MVQWVIFIWTDGSFYILPCSVHELLLFPAFIGADVRALKEIVHSMNRTSVVSKDFKQIGIV